MSAGVEGSEWTLVGGMGQTLAHGRLSFASLASTRMACESAVLQAESDFFSALERTVHGSLADGELVLGDAAGTGLLRFARTARAIEPEEF